MKKQENGPIHGKAKENPMGMPFHPNHFHSHFLRRLNMWYEKQPLEVHLRDVFKESGFEVPDYVTDIEGSKGWVDFQGDNQAAVTFTIKREDFKKFMKLPEAWKNPSNFKPIDHEVFFGGLNVPVGSFVIEKWTSSEYNCKYAVDEKSNRIYFYRSST